MPERPRELAMRPVLRAVQLLLRVGPRRRARGPHAVPVVESDLAVPRGSRRAEILRLGDEAARLAPLEQDHAVDRARRCPAHPAPDLKPARIRALPRRQALRVELDVGTVADDAAGDLRFAGDARWPPGRRLL